MEKTFTQTELETILKERLERQKVKYEQQLMEAKGGTDLQTDPDKSPFSNPQISPKNDPPENLGDDLKGEKTEEMAKKIADYEQKLANFEREKADMLKAKMLEDAGLPAALSDRLKGTTADELANDIATLQSILPKPSIGSPASPAEKDGVKVYTKDELSTMTPEQINSQWAEISAQLQNI